MTPLPPPLGGGEFVAWRIDEAEFALTWDSGEGAYQVGGRWNSRGIRAVYCAIDPAMAILEVAAHKGFRALDTTRHVLTSVAIHNHKVAHVVDPASIPNPNWLSPGTPGAGQKAFGDALLARHRFILIPSAVSTRSWNLVFVGGTATGDYALRTQEPFALDTRLHPP